MADSGMQGDWLLVDAAGPDLITGILRDGSRHAFHQDAEGVIESLQPAIERLLQETGLTLQRLRGAVYAAGPGSTLGLRLSAMFLRTLMEVPALAHWRCLAYNNLELAGADVFRRGGGESVTVLAPWRRDRLHRCVVGAGPPASFRSDFISTDEASVSGASCIRLGTRPGNLPDGLRSLAYPAREIPAVLGSFPELLGECRGPAPYQAEDAGFARWEQRRHRAR